MKETKILINDSTSYNNWRVAACLSDTIWIHLSAPLNLKQPNGYDISTTYELDLEREKQFEVNFHIGNYILWDLYPTENYLYVSVLIDVNNDQVITDEDYNGGVKLIRFDRKQKNTKELFCFPSGCFLPIIKQVVDDNYVLLNLSFRKQSGEIYERYDILNVVDGRLETLYIDDKEMFDCNLFMANTANKKVIVVRDLHVTPSDKPNSGGKADKISILELD